MTFPPRSGAAKISNCGSSLSPKTRTPTRLDSLSFLHRRFSLSVRAGPEAHSPSQMDLAPREQVIAQARAKFRAYLRSRAFKRDFTRLRQKPALWDLPGWQKYLTARREFQQVGVALCDEGH